MSEGLPIWTIYEKPSDFPEDFVVRRHVSYPGKVVADPNIAMQSRGLENLREILQRQGLTCIGRQPDDEPCIVESWV